MNEWDCETHGCRYENGYCKFCELSLDGTHTKARSTSVRSADLSARPKRLDPMTTGKRSVTVSYGIKAASQYTVAAEAYMDQLEAEVAHLRERL